MISFVVVLCLSIYATSSHPLRPLCALLAGHTALFVGPPSTTFHLHSLLLNALHSHNHANPHTCLGPDFCTWHHLCTSSSSSTTAAATTARVHRAPSPQSLLATHSSLLRYIRSDTLHTPPQHPVRPYIDPDTAVRAHDAPWLARARAPGVALLVLSTGPIPAPAWTYNDDHPNTHHKTPGNWSHLSTLPALLPPHACLPAPPTSDACRIKNAALHTTLTKLLPSVRRTLAHVARDEARLRLRAPPRRVVWHGNWYIDCAADSASPSRGNAHARLLNLRDGPVDDPWMLYHNAQVLIQDRLLPRLLNAHGIPYIPLSSAFSSVSPEQPQHTSGPRTRDCLRFPADSPRARALLDAFLDGIIHADGA